MRIDVDSSSIIPGYQPQKISGEINELYNRGEAVRGRVLDVNENIVLVQSSSGRQFSAKTTVPLDNYIGQDMSFTIILGESGEFLLIPDLEGKESKELNFKIIDILSKFGEQLTEENKQIVSQMISSGIPVTKQTFDEIKSLNTSLSSLKAGTYNLNISEEGLDIPLNQLTKGLQTIKDFGRESEVQNFTLKLDLGLKEIVILKNLGMPVTLKNLNALSDLLQGVRNNSLDITGLGDFLENIKTDSTAIENLKSMSISSLLDSQSQAMSNENLEKLSSFLKSVGFEGNDEQLINAIISGEMENLSFEHMEKLNTLSNSQMQILLDYIKDYEIDLNSNNSKTLKLNEIFGTKEEFINMLESLGINEKDDLVTAIEKVQLSMSKHIDETSDGPEDFKVKNKLIGTILEQISKSSDENVASKLNHEIIPKTNLLSNFNDRYNFNVIPFMIKDNYANLLQFYVKKDTKKKKFMKRDWVVGISLDTHNFGNIKSTLKLSETNELKISFSTENKSTKNLIVTNTENLQNKLKKIGFFNVNIDVNIEDEKTMEVFDEIVYKNSNLKIFETWV